MDIDLSDISEMLREAGESVQKERDELLPDWRSETLKQLLVDYRSSSEEVPSDFGQHLPAPSRESYPRCALANTFTTGSGAGPDGHFEGEDWRLVGESDQKNCACCIGFYLSSGKMGRLDNYNGESYLLSYDDGGRLYEQATYESGKLKEVERYVRDAAGKWMRTTKIPAGDYPNSVGAGRCPPPSARRERSGGSSGHRWWQFWK